MTSDVNLATRPGRPQQFSCDQRRRILFDAAEDVFLQKGYNSATMNDIAQRAGMSKKTVYQIFPAKTALFDALLSERGAIMAEPLRDGGDNPEEVLVEALVRITEYVFSPRQIAMTKLMLTEAQRSPEIKPAMERQCLSRGDDAIEKWLALQASRGWIAVDNPRENASMLLGAIFGKTLFDLLFEIIPQPTKEENERRIRKIVRIFLKGMMVPKPLQELASGGPK